MSLVNWKECRSFLLREAQERYGVNPSGISEDWIPWLENLLQREMRRGMIDTSKATKIIRPPDSLKRRPRPYENSTEQAGSH